MGWKDRVTPPQEQLVQFMPSFPRIQWINGNGMSPGVFGSGGFAVILKSIPYDIPRDIEGFEFGEWTHSDGSSDEVLTAPKLHFAIVVYARSFEVRDPDTGKTRPVASFEAALQEGKRPVGRLRAFVWVKELWDAGVQKEPWLLTVGGTASSAFTFMGEYYGVPGIFHEFDRLVLRPASGFAGGKPFPMYAFWCPVGTRGERQQVGKEIKAWVTLPKLLLGPNALSEDEISALAVPDEIYERSMSDYEELRGYLEDMARPPGEDTEVQYVPFSELANGGRKGGVEVSSSPPPAPRPVMAQQQVEEDKDLQDLREYTHKLLDSAKDIFQPIVLTNLLGLGSLEEIDRMGFEDLVQVSNKLRDIIAEIVGEEELLRIEGLEVGA